MKTYFITLRDLRNIPNKEDLIFGLVPVRNYIIKNPIKGEEPNDSKLDLKHRLIYFDFVENKSHWFTSLGIQHHILEYYFKRDGEIREIGSPKDHYLKDFIPLDYAILNAGILINHYDWETFYKDLEKLYNTILEDGINEVKDLK